MCEQTSEEKRFSTLGDVLRIYQCECKMVFFEPFGNENWNSLIVKIVKIWNALRKRESKCDFSDSKWLCLALTR